MVGCAKIKLCSFICCCSPEPSEELEGERLPKTKIKEKKNNNKSKKKQRKEAKRLKKEMADLRREEEKAISQSAEMANQSPLETKVFLPLMARARSCPVLAGQRDQLERERRGKLLGWFERRTKASSCPHLCCQQGQGDEGRPVTVLKPVTELKVSSELLTLQPEKHQQDLSPAEKDQLEEERRIRLRGFFDRWKAALERANACSNPSPACEAKRPELAVEDKKSPAHPLGEGDQEKPLCPPCVEPQSQSSSPPQGPQEPQKNQAGSPQQGPQEPQKPQAGSPQQEPQKPQKPQKSQAWCYEDVSPEERRRLQEERRKRLHGWAQQRESKALCLTALNAAVQAANSCRDNNSSHSRRRRVLRQ